MDDTAHFIPLDIETDDADRLYTTGPGSGFVRLLGIGDGPAEVPRPDTRIGPTCTVNGSFFDFPALDRHHGIPVESTIPFSRDLRTAAFQHDPPTSAQTKQGPAHKSYSMAALAERYLGESPDKDELKRLAREFGGYGAIPVDDPRYLRYLRADLDVTRRLNAAIPWDPYEEREAWVSTVTARTTLNGFRVDTEALGARVAMDTDRAEDGRVRLAEDYGFPLVNEAGKEAKAPQRTKAGKAAFERALTSLGIRVDAWPRGADGSLSLKKEVLEKVADFCERERHPALAVVQAVQMMNGVRNNAANLLRCVSPSGRVHPRFEPFQSTRRWSVQEPGLTVLKKGVADSERNYLVADEGDVLVSIDLDQIDIRGAAAHAQDPDLIALLNDGSRDIHTEIAVLSGVPRKQAKTLDLGWLYGRGARAMAEMPGMDLDAAQRVTGYMSGAFPGVTAWQARVREQAGAGILLDNGVGGRLRAEQSRAYTQAPALIGQSTTRELVAEGLLDLARRAPEILPMLRVIVHDELVLSVPKSDKEECARIVQEALSRQWCPPGASVPVNITAGQGKPFVFSERWGDLYM